MSTKLSASVDFIPQFEDNFEGIPNIEIISFYASSP